MYAGGRGVGGGPEGELGTKETPGEDFAVVMETEDMRWAHVTWEGEVLGDPPYCL